LAARREYRGDDITPGLAAQLASPPYPCFQDSLKLDAPLSVQALSRPGFFPFNKFSSVPVAISAARAAMIEYLQQRLARHAKLIEGRAIETTALPDRH